MKRKEFNKFRQNFNKVHVVICPHCGEYILMGLEIREKDSPIFLGDCRDCTHLEKLSESERPEPSIVAQCGFQGNMDPIFFTQAQLDNKVNHIADEMSLFIPLFGTKGKINKCAAFEPKKRRS